MFAGHHYTRMDDRHDYGETRFISVGILRERVVVIVWTQRERSRRVISMRQANDKEKTYFFRQRAEDIGLD